MEIFSIRGVRIEGVSACVPEVKTDNLQSLKELYGDEAALIVQSTGIRTRFTARSGTTTTDLCLAAARDILSGTGCAPEDIGAVVFVTFTPDRLMPFNAALVQDALGLSHEIPCFDMSLACSGYAYGLYVSSLFAKSLSASGKKVLFLDGDVQSAYTSPRDKATLPVMADAGTATLLSAHCDGAGSVSAGASCPGAADVSGAEGESGSCTGEPGTVDASCSGGADVSGTADTPCPSVGESGTTGTPCSSTCESGTEDSSRGAGTSGADEGSCLCAGVSVADGSLSSPEWKFTFYTDGSGNGSLMIPAGGSAKPVTAGDLEYTEQKDGGMRRNIDIYMDGFGIFRFVASDVSKWLKRFLEETGDSGSTIDSFVPHQANMFMIRKLALKLGFDWNSAVWQSGDAVGNSASATVPVTIAYDYKNKLVKDRENRVLVSGFGGGLSASAGIVTLSPKAYYSFFQYAGK